MNYAVIYNDRHLDMQMECFNHLEEAVRESEDWIVGLGYEVEEWSKMTQDENKESLTAFVSYYHPCEEDSVMIFKIK